MKYKKTILLISSFLLVIAFTSSASAIVECALDSQCSPTTTGEFCYEDGTGSTCTASGSNPYTICINQTSWTTNGDCIGYGIEVCHPYYNECLADSAIGEPCSFDGDCDAGVYCRLNICTPSATDCDGDGDCSSGQTCVQSVCRSKGDYGAECYKNTDCESNICDTINYVCAECDSSDGIEGDGSLPEGYFCDIEHVDVCNIDNLYPTFSQINNLKTPILDLLRDEGDSCWDDGCCATNNCVNGYCIGAGLGGDGASNFCENFNFSLSSYYLDGVAFSDPVGTAINIENLRTYFDNDSSAYLIRVQSDPFIVGKTGVMVDRQWNGGTNPYVFIGLLYSNDTGSLHYFHQSDNTLYTATLEDCTDAGLASLIWDNATYYNNSVVLNGTDITNFPKFDCSNSEIHIVSSSKEYFGTTSKLMLIAFTDFNTDHARTDFAYAFTEFSGVNAPSFSYYRPSLGTWTSIAYSPDTFTPFNTYYQDGPVSGWYNRLTIDPTESISLIRGTYTYPSPPYPSAFHTASISDYLDDATLDTVNCCNIDSDCPTNFCCGDSNSCYYCPDGAGQLGFDIYYYDSIAPASSKSLCANESIQFNVEVYDITSGSTIKPEGTITASVNSGSGTFSGSTTCYASDTPCTFTYTAPATDGTEILYFTYSGSTDYAEKTGQVQLTISEDCNFLSIYVYDFISGLPLNNVKATTTYGGIKYSTSTGLIYFGELNSDSFNITYTKDGYQSSTWAYTSADLNQAHQIDLVPSEAQTPLDEYDFPFEPPTNSSEAISGFKELTFGLLSSPLAIGLTIITFLFMIGVIKLLFESVL